MENDTTIAAGEESAQGVQRGKSGLYKDADNANIEEWCPIKMGAKKTAKSKALGRFMKL